MAEWQVVIGTFLWVLFIFAGLPLLCEKVRLLRADRLHKNNTTDIISNTGSKRKVGR